MTFNLVHGTIDFTGWRTLKYASPDEFHGLRDEEFAQLFWLFWFLAWRNALEYRRWKDGKAL